MDIGTKIRNARSDAGLTQEKAAEALGVSRQTISNWENGRTYPDIVSVIKMSDLYSVSLDRLLKEKPAENAGEEDGSMSDYIDYLGKSTDAEKSRTRLAKIILAAVFTVIWASAPITFWSFMGVMDELGFAVIFFVFILPAVTFIISLLIGTNDLFGKRKWFTVIFFGVMYCLSEYTTFSMANMIFNDMAKFNLPDLGMLLIGAAVSAAGIGIGELIRRAGKTKKRKSDL